MLRRSAVRGAVALLCLSSSHCFAPLRGESASRRISYTPRPAASSADEAPAAPTAQARDKAPQGPHTEAFVALGPNAAVTEAELSNANMLRIVRQESTDEAVNMLLHRCLGYRGEVQADGSVAWRDEEVFPKWKGKFSTPPDFVGVSRSYAPEVDRIVMEANRALVRTIPMAHKQSLKTYLRAEGFAGFKLTELTPNKTRRAQAANWLIFFREELFGRSIEELQARRREREAQEERERQAQQDGEEPPGFIPPIREVF